MQDCKKSTVISFTGDLSFSANLQKEYLQEEPISTEILDFLNDSDATVINYESPITDYRDLYHNKSGVKKRLKHRTDPEALKYLKKAFTNPILSFANNHMNDYSDIGIIDTIDNAEAEGIKYFGSGRNLEESLRYQIVGDDIKVGIFSFQYKNFKRSGIKPFMGPVIETNFDVIQKMINNIKANVDYVVAFYHGGTEFLHVPEPDKRKLIQKYLKMGCDVVVAHHPHVIQGYEYFDKKLVFYSLGNFFFDTVYQQSQKDSDKGVVVKLTFDENGVSFDQRFIKIDRENERSIPGDADPYFIELNNNNYKKYWAKEKEYMKFVLSTKRNFIDIIAGSIYLKEELNIPRVRKMMIDCSSAGDFTSLDAKLDEKLEFIKEKRASGTGSANSDEEYYMLLIMTECGLSREEAQLEVERARKDSGISIAEYYAKHKK